MQIPKIERKIKKLFFDMKKTAFELVVLNTRVFWERILVIRCQYVKKMSHDFRYY